MGTEKLEGNTEGHREFFDTDLTARPGFIIEKEGPGAATGASDESAFASAAPFGHTPQRVSSRIVEILLDFSIQPMA